MSRIFIFFCTAFFIHNSFWATIPDIEGLLQANPTLTLEKILEEKKEDLVLPLFEQLEENQERKLSPFIDRKNKDLYVYSEFKKETDLCNLCSFFLGLGVDLPSEKINHYWNLIYYQRRRAANRIHTWSVFGEKIINFSHNAQPKDLLNASIEELESVYGKEALTFWVSLSTPDTFIDKKQVLSAARNNMEAGRCLGMALYFLSMYLDKTLVSPEETTFDIVKEISSDFIQGAPLQAQLAQFCHHSTQYYPYVAQAKNNWYIDESYYIKEAFNLISLGFNLTLGSPQYSQNPSKENLDNLPPGAYLASLRFAIQGSDNHHAIAFIKTSDTHHYIFDPNYGTLMVCEDQLFETFTTLMNDYEKILAPITSISCLPCFK